MRKFFLKQAGVWLAGMIVGTIISVFALFCENGVLQKSLAVTGIVITSIATFYYAYKTWKESLNIDCGEYGC